MSNILDLTLAPRVVAVAALVAGLAAAYGRELNAGGQPGWRWWLCRLLLLPCVAIAAITAEEVLSLSTNVTAFTITMLVLGGYDALRFVEQQWRLRVLRLPSASEQLDAGERRTKRQRR